MSHYPFRISNVLPPLIHLLCCQFALHTVPLKPTFDSFSSQEKKCIDNYVTELQRASKRVRFQPEVWNFLDVAGNMLDLIDVETSIVCCRLKVFPGT